MTDYLPVNLSPSRSVAGLSVCLYVCLFIPLSTALGFMYVFMHVCMYARTPDTHSGIVYTLVRVYI